MRDKNKAQTRFTILAVIVGVLIFIAWLFLAWIDFGSGIISAAEVGI